MDIVIDPAQLSVRMDRDERDAPRCMGAELWHEFCTSVALDEAALATSYEASPYDELLYMARDEQFGNGSYE